MSETEKERDRKKNNAANAFVHPKYKYKEKMIYNNNKKKQQNQLHF